MTYPLPPSLPYKVNLQHFPALSFVSLALDLFFSLFLICPSVVVMAISLSCLTGTVFCQILLLALSNLFLCTSHEHHAWTCCCKIMLKNSITLKMLFEFYHQLWIPRVMRNVCCRDQVKADGMSICFIDDCRDADVPLAELNFASKYKSHAIWLVLVHLKLKFRKSPSIHTNYIISHSTILQYNHNIWYGSYAEKKYWTRKTMISTGLPYLQFSMNIQGFSPARLTWPAYDGGRKRENSSVWKHRIIIA